MQYCSNLDSAERFIKLVYPDLVEQTLDRTKQGNEYFTFLAKDEVIRVARNETVSNNMHREFSLLTQLNFKPFTAMIPAALDYQPDNSVMRIQKLEGNPLSEVINTLLPSERTRVAGQIGLFLAELHSFFREQSNPEQSEIVENRELLLSRLEKIRSQTNTPEEQARLQEINAYIKNYETLDDRQAMIHGDVSPSNIIYDQITGQIGVIDFNNCTSNLCHRDFSVMAHLFPTDFVQGAMSSYADNTQRQLSIATVQTGADTLSLIHGYKEEGITFKPQLNL